MMRWILMWATVFLGLNYVNGQGLHHLLINEIMADPSPVVGLPNQEYIEILNRTNDTVSLQNYWIIIGDDSLQIKEKSELLPASVVLLCKTAAVNDLKKFGPCLGLPSFPTLNNDQELISILSKDLRTIHAVPYNVKFHSNRIKSEGGWSLELADPNLPCLFSGNYRSSSDPLGGTPGKINSSLLNLEDPDPPKLAATFFNDSVTLMIRFSEPVDSFSASMNDAYLFSQQLNILNIEVIPPLFDKAVVHLGSGPSNHYFKLSSGKLKDCAGNVSDPGHEIKASLAQKPAEADIVINEVMFNPPTGGSDYVEIYNRSDKSFDLNKLLISGRDIRGDLDVAVKISKDPAMIFPGEFKAITTNSAFLQVDYNTDQMCLAEINKLPSMPDDKGIIVLTDEQGMVIDELHYDRTWHHPFLKNENGISLERLDAVSPTNQAFNWTSCATEIRGTPGKSNSQSLANNSINGGIQVEKKIFSPDNDGFEDFLVLKYLFDQPGMMGNIRIYNVHGQPVKTLLNNKLLPLNGWVRWDGSDEKNHFCKAGIYILDAQFHTPTGKRIKFREAITLAKRF